MWRSTSSARRTRHEAALPWARRFKRSGWRWRSWVAEATARSEVPMAEEDPTRYRPIIYVRGYAMSRAEIDDTTADPFCGFNLGSTVFRATPDRQKPPRKYIFESPVVRLAKDFGYGDVFGDGLDIVDEEWTRPLSRQAIVIYRYYDPASTLLGSGKTPEIDEFGKGLSRLIGRIRDLVVQDPKNG